MDTVEMLRQQLDQNRRSTLVSAWLLGMSRRSWNLRRALNRAAAGGGALPAADLLLQHCSHFLDALDLALASAPTLELGSAPFREPVQVLSFTAGWMAGVGFGIADSVALVHALQEAVAVPPLEGFFQSLIVVVTEAHTAAIAQKAQVRFREAMERCQLVCAFDNRLPGLFLVGDPDRQAVDGAVGRLMTLAAMLEAPQVVLDGSGLVAPRNTLDELTPILLDYLQRFPRRMVISGLPLEHCRRLQAAPQVTVVEELAHALALCGS